MEVVAEDPPYSPPTHPQSVAIATLNNCQLREAHEKALFFAPYLRDEGDCSNDLFKRKKERKKRKKKKKREKKEKRKVVNDYLFQLIRFLPLSRFWSPQVAVGRHSKSGSEDIFFLLLLLFFF
eukprot:TRINITY_DN5646_c0_g2_i1.p1 TRINITY_DN5646_c0_g2~~TRINITY_DN5646_c0_g2_i1.p1  ORF type:complete len:123 (+),score=7.52 TRINITY_DN5646_c0_g2_i1:6-374(+)